MNIKKIIKENKIIFGVFVLCFLYWVYLIFSTETVLRFDSAFFAKFGMMIHKEGWDEFLRTGPNREPLYPFLISVSMAIGDFFSVSYMFFQKALQVACLFLTQLLVLKVLRSFKVRESINAIAIFYVGFSPALINAAFSLYSEIIVCPIVVALIMIAVRSWNVVHVENSKTSLVWGLYTALIFIAASSVKAIFQYIYLFFLIPFIFSVLKNRKKDVQIRKNVLIYISISFLVFSVFALSYRALNYKYNGKFDFTDRYDRLLFGNAGIRTMKLDKEMFMGRIVSVPGTGFCRKFFSEEACIGSEFHHTDIYREEHLHPLLEMIPKEKEAAIALNLTLREVGRNPIQYFFLTFIESLKMAFWESTSLGFVRYPAFLEKLYHFEPFSNGIRLLISLLTYSAICFSFFFIIKNKNEISNFYSDGSLKVQTAFFMLLIIVIFTALYSMFAILTRFAIPIAPLYLIMIAFLLNKVIAQKTT